MLYVSLRREMLAIADSREAINANIEQKVSMFAGVACTGGLAGDFKMRLQKRILNIQRSIQRCGGADRESVGGWCGGRSTAGRSGELSTSASECDRAKRLSRSLSISGGGSLLTESNANLDLKGTAALAGGEAPPSLSKGKSRGKGASRRGSSTTSRLFTFTRSGGKHSSVNEIQLGPEVTASAAGEGAATRSRVPPPDESAAPGPEPGKAWRTQFHESRGASSNILMLAVERKASYAPAPAPGNSVLAAQATLSCSEAEASELQTPRSSSGIQPAETEQGPT